MAFKKKGSYKYFNFPHFNNGEAIIMWQNNISAKSWLRLTIQRSIIFSSIVSLTVFTLLVVKFWNMESTLLIDLAQLLISL